MEPPEMLSTASLNLRSVFPTMVSSGLTSAITSLTFGSAAAFSLTW